MYGWTFDAIADMTFDQIAVARSGGKKPVLDNAADYTAAVEGSRRQRRRFLDMFGA